MPDDTKVVEKPTTETTPAADAGKAIEGTATPPPSATPPPAETPPAASEKPAAGTSGDPPADKAKGGGTLLDGADGDDPAKDGDGTDKPAEKKDEEAKGDWPEAWRQLIAGKEDAKALKELERFKSPLDMYKAWKAAQQKISSGEYKRGLPKDATPEQLAEWRAEQGIPDKPDGYTDTKIDGHDWSKEDKPLLDGFKSKLHGANASQAQIDAALGYYAELVANQREQIAARDQGDRQKVEDALRSELGNEYRPALTLFKRLLTDAEVFPGDAGTKFIEARDSEGGRLINDPAIARFFIDMARDRYGDTAMVVGDGAKVVGSRIEEIKKIRSTNINEYYRQGLDKELYELESKVARRPGRAA